MSTQFEAALRDLVLLDVFVWIAVAGLFAACVTGAVRVHRVRRGRGEAARALRWVELPKYLGALALLVATFRLALGVDLDILGMPFDDEGPIRTAASSARAFIVGSFACAVGFGASWLLAWRLPAGGESDA